MSSQFLRSSAVVELDFKLLARIYKNAVPLEPPPPAGGDRDANNQKYLFFTRFFNQSKISTAKQNFSTIPKTANVFRLRFFYVELSP